MLSYMLPDILDVIRQAGFQLVPPSLGTEGAVQGPMTGDGVFFTQQDADEGAKTLALAKIMCAALNTPACATFWDTETMRWYGPSGIGTARGYQEFLDKHQDRFNHAFPMYGNYSMGVHYAEFGEGNYAAWVGWPSIRTIQVGEYLGCPPSGELIEWRLSEYDIRVILTQLLDNAVGYTPAGGHIMLRVCSSAGQVLIDVEDSGVGIASDHHDTIFRPYRFIDQEYERPERGLGVGLYIARGLAERNGGTLTLRSSLGAGSTFTLALPY